LRVWLSLRLSGAAPKHFVKESHFSVLLNLLPLMAIQNTDCQLLSADKL
jgi:hypothetical protein